jgi:phosphomannomutase
MIFGTSGARGFIDKNLKPNVVYRLTTAYLKYTGYSTVLVGQDDRQQSRTLKFAVIDALLSQGVNVLDIGLAPTPVIARMIKELKAEGAVSVTGSHTPPYIAGVLYFLKDTGELGLDDSEKVEKMFEKTLDSPKNWKKLGRYETVDDAKSIYVKSLLRDVKKVKNYRFMFDAANGVAGAYAKETFRELGLDFKIINSLPLGSFPKRLPSPTLQHLKITVKEIKKSNYDFGVATDADGDRAIFLDGNGKIIIGDIAGAYFAARQLESKKGKIVTPINSSDSIVEIARRYGAKLIWTKVGPPAMVDAVRKNKSEVVFAFEESGKYIWPEILLYGDSVYSTLKALEDENFIENLKNVPRFYVVKREVRCSDQIKYSVIDEVDRALEGKKMHKDGIKVYYKNHEWLLIRASGTEPVIRVFAHDKVLKKAEEMATLGVQLVREAKKKVEKSFH